MVFLRYVLAFFWLAHWWYKTGIKGRAVTEKFFEINGFPAWLASVVVGIEVCVVVGLSLNIGVFPLLLISLPILFGALWVYKDKGFYFATGGIEFIILWICVQIAVMYG